MVKLLPPHEKTLFGIGDSMRDLARGTDDRLTAKYFWHFKRPRTPRTQIFENTKNIRNNVSGALNNHRVSNADVEAPNLIHIMKRCPRNRYAANVNGF